MTVVTPIEAVFPRIRPVVVPPAWGCTGHLVVIPARDEAERIGACLEVLRGQGADASVVANNCADGTADLAARCGVLVVDRIIPHGGVGAARRLGASEGLERMREVRALLTNDADCLVVPDRAEANLRHLEAGAAAVCGLMLPIAEEHAALPAALLRCGALEDRFLDLKATLDDRLTGYAGHEQTPGASLAFTPEAYAAAGGFDVRPADENRAIILRLKALGLPVVHAREVTVYASCRLVGRAPGGMAAALRERSADPDAPLRLDMRRSEVPEVAAVLALAGRLRTQADLPKAIEAIERVLAQGRRPDVQ